MGFLHYRFDSKVPNSPYLLSLRIINVYFITIWGCLLWVLFLPVSSGYSGRTTRYHTLGVSLLLGTVQGGQEDTTTSGCIFLNKGTNIKVLSLSYISYITKTLGSTHYGTNVHTHVQTYSSVHTLRYGYLTTFVFWGVSIYLFKFPEHETPKTL